MAFEPVKASPSSLSLGNLSKNQEGNRLNNKPAGLLEDLNSSTRNLTTNDRRDVEDKRRDKVSLSEQAQQFVEARTKDNKKFDERTQTDKAAIEFRGLTQLSKTRDLTESETGRLNQIKNDFSASGIDEKGIQRIADNKLLESRLEAPALVQQLDSGQITGNDFAKLTNIDEDLNKANGFGVAQDDQQAKAPEVEKVKSDFNSIVEVNKDRQLSRDDLSNLNQLARQLSSIQGFQLSVKNTVGPNGVVI